MNFRIIILTLFSVFILLSCGGTSKPKLSGTIKNAEGQSLIFEKIERNNPMGIDTLKLDKSGKFEFDLPSNQVDFYRLNLGNNNFIVLCLDSSNTNTIIEGDG